MATFARILGALLWMLPLAPVHMARAQGAPAAPPERFAGEARLGSHPPLPVHVELDRAGVPVTGTITIPGSSFELGDAQGTGTVVARFRGAGGSGAITLRTDGDLLTGEFELEGQPGTIAAQRTHHDAAAFLGPPEQRMDLAERQWLDDLDRLIDILEREHAAPFHRVSAERFEHEAGQVRAAIPALDAVSIALEFRRLGALIGDAHTSVDLPHARPRLPIDLYWFEDGLRVVGLPAQHRDLLGARLIAVDEVPAAAIEQRLRAYIAQGETEWHYRARMPDLAKDPDVLRAIGLGAAPSFSFTLETGGRQAHVVLSAGEADEPPAQANLNPFWERNPGQGFWHELLADGSVYVNWRSYDGLAEQSADLMRRLDTKHPRRLIVDLRDNDGGDYNVGRAFVESIRSRPWLNRSGVLYVLIGRKTFSAAMTNAIDFRQKTEAVLVGEPAGAAPNNWQEVRHFHLPNSGLRVGVSTRYYAFLPGSPEVRPDHLVPPAPDDWTREHDAGLRFVLAQPLR